VATNGSFIAAIATGNTTSGVINAVLRKTGPEVISARISNKSVQSRSLRRDALRPKQMVIWTHLVVHKIPQLAAMRSGKPRMFEVLFGVLLEFANVDLHLSGFSAKTVEFRG
jgi:hypothetical protein